MLSTNHLRSNLVVTRHRLIVLFLVLLFSHQTLLSSNGYSFTVVYMNYSSPVTNEILVSMPMYPAKKAFVLIFLQI